MLENEKERRYDMAIRDIIPWGRKSEVQESKELSPFDALHREINRVFDSFFDDFANFPSRSLFDRALSTEFTRSFTPKFNINETDKEIKIDVELPGLTEQDVKVDYQDGVLTVEGEKKFQKEDKKDNYHLIEHSYGSFRRSVRLPDGIKEDEITAKMKNGVMQIVVPKDEKAQSKVKKIEVKKEA